VNYPEENENSKETYRQAKKRLIPIIREAMKDMDENDPLVKELNSQNDTMQEEISSILKIIRDLEKLK